MISKRNVSWLALPLVLAGILALWLMPGAPAAAAADATWRARYFNNRDLSGEPAWRRDEDAIDHDWGGGSPNAPLINDDNFSVRWTRSINLPAGTYRFYATMDDGMRVWIDDQLVIDNWTPSQQHTVTADRYLNGGDHAFRVEYFEAGGVAVAKFSWQAIGAGAPAPGNAFRGEYFANRNLSGAAQFTRDDAAINFDWGDGAPAANFPNDNFSVRWTRTLNFNPGTYRFDVFSDDGVRLWVNNQLIIDQWRDQPDGRFSATVNLSGNTPLRLEYYDNTGRAAVALSWTALSGGTPTGGATATVISTLRLNVRNAPSVSGGALLQQLQPGQTVGLTGFKSADSLWVEIFRPGGGTGWVYARWVDTSVPVSSLAVK